MIAPAGRAVLAERLLVGVAALGFRRPAERQALAGAT
jgi:hypothetical protein